jgi:putative hemolysin
MITALRVLLVGAVLVLAACSSHDDSSDVPQKGNSVNIGAHSVNMDTPAYAACSMAGGQLRLAPQLDGSRIGMCSLSNGRQCSEAALLQGRCSAG